MKILKNQPLVSTVIGTYNAELYVEQTLKSILSQNYPHQEVVVVDDASRDTTWEILNSIRDSRLRCFRNPHNRGIPATRNRGFQMARGEFISFFDHDDIMLPGAMEPRADFLTRHKNVNAVFGYVKAVVGKKSRALQRHPHSEALKTVRFCRLIKVIHHPLLVRFSCAVNLLTTLMVKRVVAERVGRFDQGFKMLECRDYVFRINRLTPLYFLDIPVMLYRWHDKNTSKTVSPKLFEKDCMRLYRKHWKFLNKDERLLFNGTGSTIKQFLKG